MSHQIIWEPEGLYIDYLDVLSSSDLFEVHKVMLASAEIDHAKYIISNFSNVNNALINVSDVEIIKGLMVRTNVINPMIKIAMVTEQIEINRLCEIFIERTQIDLPHARQRIFKTLVSAKQWALSE